MNPLVYPFFNADEAALSKAFMDQRMAEDRAAMAAISPDDWAQESAALRERMAAKDRAEDARLQALAADRAFWLTLSDEQYIDWLIANPAMI